MSASLNFPLARAEIDRSADTRGNPTLLADAFHSESSVCLILAGDKVLANSQAAGIRYLRSSQLHGTKVVPLAYLGKTIRDEGDVASGSAVLLVDLGDDFSSGNSESGPELQAIIDDGEWLNLRRSGAGLSDRDSGLLTQALALAHWHRSHGHCANCGSLTESVQAGWARHCSKCDRDVFPRTDPAVICSVIDDEDRILLGSQGAWEENRWSILAGFVDPGESLTAAVAREMHEESGLTVTDIEYLGSQPWPYPFSLMVGFTARAHGAQQLHPDGVEIAKLRWFSRQELLAEAAEIYLPSRVSISRGIIEHWLGQVIESKTELEVHKDDRK